MGQGLLEGGGVAAVWRLGGGGLRKRREGDNIRLKASDASRGRSEGRWSMEMTERGGPDCRLSTGTVGLSKVVATV
jgi:hypothetical protein